MKWLSAFAFLVCLSFFAQMAQSQVVFRYPEYVLDTVYPYNILLTDMDSTQEFTSKQVLAQPEKGPRQPIVLAFWLTTCPPCRTELSTYTANYEAWKKQANFRLLAISLDHPHRFRDIGRLAREMGFPFEVYWDVHRFFRAVMPGGLNGLPQVFIIDKEGQIAYYHKGFRPGDEQELFQKILQLQ